MRMRSWGWVMGPLGLVFVAGRAWAQDQPTEITGRDIANEMTGAPECHDAGVTVSFTTGSVELDTNARGALDGVATWMKVSNKRTLHLQGYADTTGNSDANRALSEKRADAVRDYLVSQGVVVTKIMTVGRGEEADHLPASGRAVTLLACQPRETAAAFEPRSPPAGLAIPPEYGDGSKFGWAVMAGGGYQDFANSEMRDRTNGGGAWNVRFIGGTRSYLGVEGAYVGAARSIQTLGVTANNPTLVSNGLEGNLRLNVPIMKGASLIEPYGVVGLGWSRYHISNYNSNTATLSDFNSADDNVMTVPLGVGLAYGYNAFIVDVRGTYSPTYYNNLLQASNGSGTLNTWGLGGQVGIAF